MNEFIFHVILFAILHLLFQGDYSYSTLITFCLGRVFYQIFSSIINFILWFFEKNE